MTKGQEQVLTLVEVYLRYLISYIHKESSTTMLVII